MNESMDRKTDQTRNPLGYEPISRLLLRFALPAVIAMLVNAVYNIVDQIFIGQGVGYLGNAATTIAFPVMTITLAIATLLGAGGSAFAAIKLGGNEFHKAEKTLGNVFLLLLIIGILVAVLGLVFLDPILVLFGATQNTMSYARDYTSIILIGMPFSMISIGLSNMARTDGQPALSMYSMLAGAVLNTILDPIYIFVLGWGVKGAAIATITSQMISAVVLTWYFVRNGNMRITKESMKIDGSVCGAAVSLGISSCVLQMAATLLQIVMNNSLVYYGNQSTVGGDAALSAMGVVMKINMIIISICIGIGIGSQPILGFNRGAAQPRRIKQTYLTAVSVATAITVAGWILCMSIPQIILKLFGTQDPNFTDFAVKCMRIYLAGIFCAGFQIVSTSYFQATGQPVKATILSMMRQIILLIPLIAVLPLFMGLDGILAAGPVADISSGILVLLFILFEMKRLNQWIKEVETKKDVKVSST